ncbi:MAG TPA: glycosyltransferase family 9 protein [Alphaproteobacteria bacterium]
MTEEQEVIERLKRRYRVQDAAFRLLDTLAGRIAGVERNGAVRLAKDRPRILIANAGHLGDVVMSTAVFPVLRHAFPGVEIGFLAGSYSRPVLDGHPFVRWIHYVDHWYLSRAAAAPYRKAIRYYRERRRVIDELRDCRYDLAIDLRAWFPNFISLLRAARIPLRVGYDRVGFGSFLTHRLSYRYDRRHEIEHYLDLLRSLPVPAQALAHAWPNLPPVPESAAAEATAVLGDVRRFRVLHPAASTPARDWPIDCWKMLAQELLKEGITPVLTGRGVRDADIARAIAAAVPGCINACDRLSWGGLAALIHKAELVYSVETSIGHVAAAFLRPTVSICGGMADPSHWKPFGANAVVATNALPCHPCFNSKGCATRGCLTGLSVAQVHAAAQEALRRCATSQS